jgi:hypothetical protein
MTFYEFIIDYNPYFTINNPDTEEGYFLLIIIWMQYNIAKITL